MALLIKFWFIIGLAINAYYLTVKGSEYDEQIREGKLKPRKLFLGCVLTIIAWPVAIFNNEFRKK